MVYNNKKIKLQGKIAPTANIIGQTLIKGKHTVIGQGAIIKDSYLENVNIKAGAKIVDSVIIGTRTGKGEQLKKKKDFKNKWLLYDGIPVIINENAEITGSTLENTSVGKHTRCINSALLESTIGSDNEIKDTYSHSIHTEGSVRLIGPTEISGAWLGHHTVIDKCGYFEGIFSNDFYIIEYNPKKKNLVVKEIVDIPHLSRYGMNMINSANSGRIRPQPGNRLRSLGKHVGLWHDSLLHYEPIMLGPCCWVGGWTKIVGKSARQHNSPEELVENADATYLMPFSAAGINGQAVSGQVMPGELNNSNNYKQRFPAWVFTYAPGAVINMVKRLSVLMQDNDIVDKLPMISLQNALALTYYYAQEKNVDLNSGCDKSIKGRKGWLINLKKKLEQHIRSGLWKFKNGEPVNWQKKKNKWAPRQPELLLKIAPDAIKNQLSENDLVKCDMPSLARSLGANKKELSSTFSEITISSEASVSKKAFIGPGVKITGKSFVEDGAWLFRTVVNNSVIKKKVTAVRCAVNNSEVGEETSVLCSSIKESSIGNSNNIKCARIEKSAVAERTIIYPYSKIQNTKLKFPSIIGSNIFDSEVNSILMSYHMPGEIRGLKVIPTEIRIGKKTVNIYTVPMLGGGIRVLGDKKKNVTVECSFLGSNAILEAGSYVGFGSFVLGRLGNDEGLLPFTISTALGPEKDRIAAAAFQLANIVITHFLSWSFQANGPENADYVGRIVREKLKQGKNAVVWAMNLRRLNKKWDDNALYSKYKSLKLYSDKQLQAGLRGFETALKDDMWQMKYNNKELCFSGKGTWIITDGFARWKPNGKK